MQLGNHETLDPVLEQDWLTVWFNRPNSRNALSGEMVADLTSVFEALKSSTEIRGVTLRGRGGVFCAGGDLKGFRSSLEDGEQVHENISDASLAAGKLFRLISEVPQVTVVLVQGAAMAGGLGIACAGDVVAVEESATFALTETAIGIPPAQIAPLVVERLGLPTAKRLMLTARRFDGAEAMRLGLADFVEKDVAGLEECEARLRRQVRNCAPGANAMTKEIVLATRHLDGPAMVELAATRFATALLSAEGREGIAAFLESRKPAWADNTLAKRA